jgi:hypothetical protein
MLLKLLRLEAVQVASLFLLPLQIPSSPSLIESYRMRLF